METGLKLHTIYKVEVLEGHTKADVDKLAQVILKNSHKRLSDNQADSRFEDSYCPDHPIVDQIIGEILETIKQSVGAELKLKEKWGLVHQPNMSTNQHRHGDTAISSVVYLKVPEKCGHLVFVHDDVRTSFGPPIKGSFLLFPGGLEHFVTRNLSKEPRVSLSLNFN